MIFYSNNKKFSSGLRNRNVTKLLINCTFNTGRAGRLANPEKSLVYTELLE